MRSSFLPAAWRRGRKQSWKCSVSTSWRHTIYRGKQEICGKLPKHCSMSLNNKAHIGIVAYDLRQQPVLSVLPRQKRSCCGMIQGQVLQQQLVGENIVGQDAESRWARAWCNLLQWPIQVRFRCRGMIPPHLRIPSKTRFSACLTNPCCHRREVDGSGVAIHWLLQIWTRLMFASSNSVAERWAKSLLAPHAQVQLSTTVT